MAQGEWKVPGGIVVGLVADKAEKPEEEKPKTPAPKKTATSKK